MAIEDHRVDGIRPMNRAAQRRTSALPPHVQPESGIRRVSFHDDDDRHSDDALSPSAYNTEWETSSIDSLTPFIEEPKQPAADGRIESETRLVIPLGACLKARLWAKRHKKSYGDDDGSGWRAEDFLKCYKLKPEDERIFDFSSDSESSVSDDNDEIENEVNRSWKHGDLEKSKKQETRVTKKTDFKRGSKAKMRIRRHSAAITFVGLGLIGTIFAYFFLQKHNVGPFQPHVLTASPPIIIIAWYTGAIIEALILEILPHLVNTRIHVVGIVVQSLYRWTTVLVWSCILSFTWSKFVVNPPWVGIILKAVIIISILMILRKNINGIAVFEFGRRRFEKEVRELHESEMVIAILCADAESQRHVRRDALFRSSITLSYDQVRNAIIKRNVRLPLRYTLSKSGQYIWYCSDTFVTEVSNTRELAVVAPILWRNLTGDANAEEMEYKLWHIALGKNRKLAKFTYKSFFAKPRSTSKLSRRDFVEGIDQFLKRRARTAANMLSWRNMARVTTRMFDFLFGILLIYIVAALFGQSLSSFALSFSSILLALAFALKESLSVLIESFIFVLSIHPYDVSDRIVLDKEIYQVVEINLLTTTFKTLANKHMIYSNAKLARSRIYNLRKEDSACVELSFEIDFHTTSEEMKKVRREMIEFVRENSDTWKPTVHLYVSDTIRLNSLILKVSLEVRRSWQETMVINYARSAAIERCRNALNDAGIIWKFPAFR